MNRLSGLFLAKNTYTFDKGNVIADTKQLKQNVYFVVEGFIAVYQINTAKDHAILHLVEEGDIFPMTENGAEKNIQFEMKAVSPVQVMIMDKRLFFDKVFQDAVLLRELYEKVAEYLLLYRERIENLEYRMLDKRVIARLLHFAERFGKERNGNILIRLPMSHELIAESINAARENVTRTLLSLQKAGYIAYENGVMTILQKNELVRKLRT